MNALSAYRPVLGDVARVGCYQAKKRTREAAISVRCCLLLQHFLGGLLGRGTFYTWFRLGRYRPIILYWEMLPVFGAPGRFQARRAVSFIE